MLETPKSLKRISAASLGIVKSDFLRRVHLESEALSNIFLMKRSLRLRLFDGIGK